MILSKANVLIVDDEPLVLDMFKRTLELENYNVLTASNATDATKLLKGNLINIFICDIILPDLDGFQLLNIAKSQEKDISIFMITAAPNPIDKERAIRLGAQYFIKPISLNELRNTINNCTIRNSDSEHLEFNQACA